MKKSNQENKANSVNGTLSAECGEGVALGNHSFVQEDGGRHPATGPRGSGDQATLETNSTGRAMTHLNQGSEDPNPKTQESTLQEACSGDQNLETVNEKTHNNTKTTENPKYPQNQWITVDKSRGNEKNRRNYKILNVDYLQSEPYYLKIINITFPGKNVDKDIDIIQTEEDLIRKIGDPERITKGGYNSLQISTKNKTQSEKLLKIKFIDSNPVIVTPHKTLNTVRGVIKCPVINKTPTEKLKEKLSPQAVSDIRRISVKRGNEIIETNTYVLTFKQLSLPSHINITSWYKIKVTPYIERPQQCLNCIGYGHVKKYCRRQYPICARCGQEGHSLEHCEAKEPNCLYCGGLHRATSKNCERYEIELEILATANSERISKYEAKKQVLSRTPQPKKQYSDAVKQREVQREPNQKDQNNNNNAPETMEVEVEIHQPHMPRREENDVNSEANQGEQCKSDNTPEKKRSKRSREPKTKEPTTPNKPPKTAQSKGPEKKQSNRIETPNKKPSNNHSKDKPQNQCKTRKEKPYTKSSTSKPPVKPHNQISEKDKKNNEKTKPPTVAKEIPSTPVVTAPNEENFGTATSENTKDKNIIPGLADYGSDDEMILQEGQTRKRQHSDSKSPVNTKKSHYEEKQTYNISVIGCKAKPR